MVYLIVSQSGGSEALFDSISGILELNGEIYAFDGLYEAVLYCNNLWKGTTVVQTKA